MFEPENQRHDLYAIVSPGFETVLAREVGALGVDVGERERGGLSFRGTIEDAFRANLWLRTATRVLLRVGEFDAPGRRELVARAARLPWAEFVPPDSKLRVQVTCRGSRLYHTKLVAEALHEASRTTPPGESLDAPQLFVRIVDDRCTLSLDTSGAPLHKRGHRQEVGEAPLRETIAAGVLLASHWDGTQPFVDPMCGTGALVVEAALIATGRAPGLDRAFAMESFPGFDAARFEALRDEAREKVRPLEAGLLYCSDLNAGALGKARRNLQRLGVAEQVAIERLDAARRKAPAPTGLIAVNPPWGRRLSAGHEALAAVKAAFEGEFRHWTRAVLAPRHVVQQIVPRKPDKLWPVMDGGSPVRLARLFPDPE